MRSTYPSDSLTKRLATLSRAFIAMPVCVVRQLVGIPATLVDAIEKFAGRR